MRAPPHLFVDISSHGLGHLAQTAPVLNALSASCDYVLTIRSGLTREQLEARIHRQFRHIHTATDFGFVMRNAVEVDVEASAARYRAEFANWSARLIDEILLLRELNPDLVLSNISPLPLAGALPAGIPAVAMCSLNWAELFDHYFGREPWAYPILNPMRDAYASADRFLIFTPGMPMPGLRNTLPVGPVSTAGKADRKQVAAALDLPMDRQWLLLALGGIKHRLPVEDWPAIEGTQYVLPRSWCTPALAQRPEISFFSGERLPFAELLPNVDAVLTKPGYGTFTEATCNGVPVIYMRRPDWPEQDYLIEWLHANNRAVEIGPQQAESGELQAALAALHDMPIPPRPMPTGIEEAVQLLASKLRRC